MAIPLIIHLFNRRSTRTTDWGAMQFLADSVAARTTRIQLEDALLMATRCLIIGAIALALARPFAPPGSTIPYIVVLPAILLSIGLFAVATALWENKKARGWLLLAACITAALTAVAIAYEGYLNLRRIGGGDRDVALIIDTSSSMGIQSADDAQSNFNRALDEARDIVLNSANSTAFCIIAAGPSSTLTTASPATDRESLNQSINQISLTDGQFNGLEAIRTAIHALETGTHEEKQIIVLTDGQAFGWQPENQPAWAALTDGTQLLLRQLKFPKKFRNLAVTDIQFSRDVIGIDREASIDVTIENTGTQAITPKAVQLRTGDTVLIDTSTGQLPPGTSATATFRHRFLEPGAHVLTAVADIEDDLAADNSFSSAIPILDRIDVMIVDGHPAAEFFDRASAFVELALAPGIQGKRNYLIEPTIVPAPQILSVQLFETYQAVILTDVPRLPAPVAAQLGRYVSRGGGLLIAPGRSALPEFYNNWALAPAQLKNFTTDSTSPAPSSFTHPAVRKIANTDVTSANLTAHWQLDVTDPTTTVAASLADGAPFIAIRQSGAGTVAMTACSLDTHSGNLVTRDGFLPFLHELTYHLASPETLNLNLDATPDLTLTLSQDRTPDEQLDTFAATDPRGQLREAALFNTPTGTIAKISGPTIAGLYEIEIPPSAQETIDAPVTPAGTLPFTVIRPAEESRLQPLTRRDIDALSKHITILRPESTKDIHTILAGRSYGQELWKILAIGALLLLVSEVALTNWIAKNRRTNQPIA